jgi:hypothetical protein
MSAAPPRATVAIGPPVAGLVATAVAPERAGRHRPAAYRSKAGSAEVSWAAGMAQRPVAGVVGMTAAGAAAGSGIVTIGAACSARTLLWRPTLT